MMAKDTSSVHIQYLRELLERIERKLDTHIERNDAKMLAFENELKTVKEDYSKSKNRVIGLLIGTGAGSGGLGAYLTHLFR